METSTLACTLACALLPAALRAQTDLPPDFLEPPPPPNAFTNTLPPEALRDWQAWTVLGREECSTTREFRYPSTNGLTGEVMEKVATVVEVGNGLNYLDQGEWKESLEVIQLTSSGAGASAVYAPHKLYCDADLSTGIALVTRSNRVVISSPLSIHFFNPANGHSFELATLNPSARGELLPPNQVVWLDAFSSEHLRADFVVTFARLGVQAEVRFTRKVTPPEECSPLLDPDQTQLQVRHTFMNAGTPRVSNAVLGPGLADEILDMGDMFLPTGTAFETPADAPRAIAQPAPLNRPWSPADQNSIPVGKAWTRGAESDTLTESVLWRDVAPKLNRLPDLAKAGAGTNWLADAALQGQASAKGFQVASAPYSAKGVGMDYLWVSSGQAYTFSNYVGNNTYFITNGVTFDSVTFSNCVIKFAPNAYLKVTGQIRCYGTNSILTSRDDPAFGEQAPGSSGCPANAANPAIWVYHPAWYNVLSGMRVRWATTAFRFQGDNCASYPQTLSNSIVESCYRGAYMNSKSVTVTNSKAREVSDHIYYDSCMPNGSFTTQVSLAQHIITGTLALTNGHTPSPDKQIYSDWWKTNYNPNCWLAGLRGLSSISISNRCGTNCASWYQGFGTLISSRYAISATHQIGKTSIINRPFTFLDRNAVATNVICLDYEPVKINGLTSDMLLLLLDRDLPTNRFDHVRLLPTTITNKMPFLVNTAMPTNCIGKSVPAITVNQYRDTRVSDFYKLQSYQSYPYVGMYSSFRTLFFTNSIPLAPSEYLPEWDGYVVKGDSGGPVFLLVNNELVLLALMHSWDAGPTYGFHLDAISSAVSNLVQRATLPKPPQQAPELFDLSSFPDLN